MLLELDDPQVFLDEFFGRLALGEPVRSHSSIARELGVTPAAIAYHERMIRQRIGRALRRQARSGTWEKPLVDQELGELGAMGPTPVDTSVKLTPDDVLELRRRFDAGERCKVLALEWGVSYECARNVCHRRSWRHV